MPDALPAVHYRRIPARDPVGRNQNRFTVDVLRALSSLVPRECKIVEDEPALAILDVYILRQVVDGCPKQVPFLSTEFAQA